ncbi:uncharacterized protein N7500_008820 [Penicillium coprophilum]|uniref:uncharacterized protein n=1 Tax=Penicillium coprophilum TaxID=36646 RepID=UPI0023857AB1|nr:uncharacterized protein N7500_008820 [Penicillium coprophilum]KAJ5159169.1 hypothetical protein N7500_008820 [Penicillium coprophilum]
MPYYQASVFQSNQLEHGTRFHFRDPHDSQPGWIWGTIALPDTMDLATNDKDIIMHIWESIEAGLVNWGNSAMHGLGIRHPRQGLDLLMLQIQSVALWYAEYIIMGSITIDKGMLFMFCEGPPEREDQLLIEPLHWGKPEYAVANPWCTTTELQD